MLEHGKAGGGGVSNRSTGWKYQRKNNRGTTFVSDWNRVDHLADFIIRLKNAQLENDDARDVIARYDAPGCLFYVDPPYPDEVRGSSNDYEHETDSQLHVDIANQLRNIQGMSIVSGYRCELYNSLYEGWQTRVKSVRADTGETKDSREEVLWLSPAVVQNLASSNLFQFLGDSVK